MRPVTSLGAMPSYDGTLHLISSQISCIYLMCRGFWKSYLSHIFQLKDTCTVIYSPIYSTCIAFILQPYWWNQPPKSKRPKALHPSVSNASAEFHKAAKNHATWQGGICCLKRRSHIIKSPSSMVIKRSGYHWLLYIEIWCAIYGFHLKSFHSWEWHWDEVEDSQSISCQTYIR